VASRADGRASARSAATLPRLGTAFRAALSDYYFNSMRLVAANALWGAGLIGVLIVGLAWPLGALLLLPLLALPAAGMFRMAARIVRGEPDVGLRDVLWPYRRAAGSTLLLGAAFVAVLVVLATNLVVGIVQAAGPGLVVATLAAWGVVALWTGALVAWPLLVDPARSGQPLGDRLRLAGGLLLVDPVRFGALAMVVALVSLISIALTAAILTVSVSFVALLACRTVYPAADRLQPSPHEEPA
jgi:uncharacterized membrane protein YesL